MFNTEHFDVICSKIEKCLIAWLVKDITTEYTEITEKIFKKTLWTPCSLW